MSVASDALTGIRAVAFDAVGTVMTPEPSVADVYLATLRAFGVTQVAAEHVRSRIRSALQARSRNSDLSTSESAERQFWYDLVTSFCPDESAAEQCFARLFRHFADPTNWRCFPDVAACLTGLRNRGFRVVLASNFDSRLHTVVRGLEALQSVDDIVVSSEVGWRKPAGQFFGALAASCACREDEILMVGDDLLNDVDGARRAGMQALLLDRRPAARSEPEDRHGSVIRSLDELT